MAKVEQERQDSFLELEDDDDLILGGAREHSDALQDSHNEDDLMLELEEFDNY